MASRAAHSTRTAALKGASLQIKRRSIGTLHLHAFPVALPQEQRRRCSAYRLSTCGRRPIGPDIASPGSARLPFVFATISDSNNRPPARRTAFPPRFPFGTQQESLADAVRHLLFYLACLIELDTADGPQRTLRRRTINLPSALASTFAWRRVASLRMIFSTLVASIRLLCLANDLT